MHQLAAIEPADDVAAAFAQGTDAAPCGGRAADEVQRAGDAAQRLECLGRAGIDRALGAELRRYAEFRVVDVAGDDVLRALRAQDRNADQPQSAAAEYRNFIL